ncbi:uncharacterized protein MONOS_1126 [Monocercomonoides exilis]|uniref:uncharacterized protein n=1 Tax=Monocercomonoides exilis TaxID=2049356 RepID=UPI0035593E30|nr:hypothetical protein MONOS_1126 [Monocercomonoides exilis]|eukprot:MONOS_1126.1-p1 / transcript=MONOS_1126.1 / gene=MONOS_1126 / organism=Monocercomonoides_exilis_PA203 / gene_product=unspecified product / transcript_product=unspecified product / location=Mono_scaffold00019:63449-64637(+) / protein_length=364 / sequence_SO=supercontig / SO=protein_coding / is_pseudo=false
MYMKTGSGVADILTDLSIKAIFNKTKSYLRKGEFGMAVITVVDGIIDVLYPSKSPVTANLTNRRGTNSIALALASVFLTFTVIGCAWRYKSKRNKKILVNDKAFSQPSTNNLAAGALKPTYVRNSANEDFANKSNRRDEGIIQKNVIAVQNVLKDSSASKNVEAINENNRPLQGKEYPTQKISNKNEQSFVPKSKKVIDDNDLLEEQLKREAMAEDSNIVHSLVEREKNREIEDSIMYEYTKRKEEEEKKVEEEKIRRVIEAGERRKEIEEKERRRREMEKRKIAAEERRKVIEAEERRKEIEAEERKRKAIKEEERRKAIEAKEKKEREKEEKERQIDSSTKFIDSFGGGDCLEGGGVEDDW